MPTYSDHSETIGRFRIGWITLAISALATAATASVDPPHYLVQPLQIDDELTAGAVDLVFDDEHRLFLLRPSNNAVVRLERDGFDFVTDVWQDDYAEPIDGEGNCSDLGAGRSTFCFDCDENLLYLYRPMTNATSIEFVGGTLVMPRTSGQLGLYRTSLHLWYVCGATTGPGEPAEIAEFNITPDAEGAFGLAFKAGLAMVVGGVQTDDREEGVGSRTGSGSGGGGPYPGEDEEWDLGDSSGYESLGADIAVADFDQDTSQDLIVLHPDEDAASFLAFIELTGTADVPGGALFGRPISFTTVDAPVHVTAGDFNGDGANDVAIIGSAPVAQLHLGDGAGNFTIGETIPLSGEAAAMEALDIEGDGRFELLISGGTELDDGWLLVAGLASDGDPFAQAFAFDGLLSAIAIDEIGIPRAGANAAVIERIPGIIVNELNLWGLDAGGMGKFPPELYSPVDIAIGVTHLIAADEDGQVFCWGADGYGESTVPTDIGPVSHVAAAPYFSVALQDDGTVRCWGRNNFGQLDVPDDLGPVQAISANSYNTAVVQMDGSVRVWGANQEGQADVPDDLIEVIDVACGVEHTVVLQADGTVRCWGHNIFGQCDVPSDLGSAVAIAAGTVTSLALLEDGTVRCWGDNFLCNMPSDLSNVVSIDAGDYHAAALLADGSVVCWGNNSAGQLNVPANLPSVARIACGKSSTIAHVVDDIFMERVHWLEIQLQSGIPADLNGDGRVDGADLTILLAYWGKTGAADLNNDGQIDGGDLTILLAAWTDFG